MGLSLRKFPIITRPEWMQYVLELRPNKRMKSKMYFKLDQMVSVKGAFINDVVLLCLCALKTMKVETIPYGCWME